MSLANDYRMHADLGRCYTRVPACPIIHPSCIESTTLSPLSTCGES